MSVVLVLGGARSGKSRYAESLIQAPKHYVATAQAFDDEMKERIKKHQARRDGSWTNHEAPLDLVLQLRDIDGWGNHILVDCLTLWLSNLMLDGADCETEVSDLVEHLTTARARIVIVSNEVGLGIVPDNQLARSFRDIQGLANQLVAAIAESVVMTVAGIPMLVKGPWPK
jgi:adenosylcobinamide kinase / adenosylcobinamide-phosphate guanylyltransferase